MSDDVQTIRDVLGDTDGAIPAWVLPALGLDPATVLDRDCETCILDDGTRAAVPGDDCPDCDGTGRIEVNRIVVIGPDDLRALRIGRAVLASVAIPSMDGFAEAYRLGWNNCRETFLDAGGDDE